MQSSPANSPGDSRQPCLPGTGQNDPAIGTSRRKYTSLPADPAETSLRVNPWYQYVVIYHKTRNVRRYTFRYSNRDAFLTAPQRRRCEAGHRTLTVCPDLDGVLLVTNAVSSERLERFDGPAAY